MDTLKLFQNSKEFNSYEAGEIVFTSGSVALEMYVVKKGKVDIIYNNQVIESLNPGEIFGEMALIDDKPRSATAVAKTECQLVSINKEKFGFLIQQSSVGSDFAIQVMKVMAERIRKVNYLMNR